MNAAAERRALAGGMMNNGKPWWTAAQMAECEAHWAKVRARLHSSDAHAFGDDTSRLVEMHRALARASIEGAARHMRLVKELTAWDPTP